MGGWKILIDGTVAVSLRDASRQSLRRLRRKVSWLNSVKRLPLGGAHSLMRAADEARDSRNWPAAIKAYAEVLKRRPKLAHIWIQYGHALKEQGFTEEAVAAYRRSASILPTADAQFQIARALRLLGDSTAALASYGEALTLGPSDDQLICLGDEARDLRSWSLAEKAYALVLERAPDLAHVWIHYGYVLKEQGATEAALAAYRRSGSILPSACAKLQVGRVLRLLGDPTGALANYKEALKLGASDDELICLGDEARDLKSWSLAEEAYALALARSPDLAHIWVQYGHTLWEQGRPNDALAAYHRAEGINPNADTYLQIGRIHEILGDYKSALTSYENALRFDPDLNEIRYRVKIVKAHLRYSDPTYALAPMEVLSYVILGTTGTCNASCIHCPTGKPETDHVPRTPMSMALFEKIIDGIADRDIIVKDHIAFGLFGDGLVDPYVVKRAAYLRSSLPAVRLSVNTNGAAFNQKKHAGLSDLVSVIALHCESLVPAVYNDLMSPLRAERVFPKFGEILDTFPGKVVVSVPVSKLNISELPSIRESFLERGAVDVIFAGLISRCAEDRTTFDALALGPHPIRCPPLILDNLIVDCDGEVLLCCNDFQRKVGIGNLSTDDFDEVLNGVERVRVRNILREGRHEELKTCSICYGDTPGVSFDC